jgi:hypothetical protein
VISHLPVDGAVVSGIHLEQRRSKKYLYLETSGKPGIMVVNITKVTKPFVMKDVDLPKDIRVDSFRMIGNGFGGNVERTGCACGSQDHKRSRRQSF